MRAENRAEILEYLKNRDGDYGLYYYNLNNGEEFAYNENMVFPAASIIKVPIMIEFFRQSEAGLIEGKELVAVPPGERVGNEGILQVLRDDIKLQLTELVALMIIVSDNTATNLLIDKLGFENINKLFKKRSYKTCLKRKMLDFKARTEGRDNLTTAGEIAQILNDIYQGNFKDISQKSCEEMISIMSKQLIRDKLSFYIPEADWSKVASKTGTLNKIEHDASIFNFDDKKFVLVLLSKNLPANAYGNVTIAQTARKILGL